MSRSSLQSINNLIEPSLLDVISVSNFLELLRTKTQNNPIIMWEEICTLTHHLKASRDVINSCSNLLSNKFDRKMLDKLVESCNILLNAEKVFLLEIDSINSGELIIKYPRSPESKAEIRVPVSTGIEGKVHLPVYYLSACSSTSQL
jgi:hypothetical protein